MPAEKSMSGGQLLTPGNLSTEQSAAIDFLYEREYGLLIAGTGVGKTVIGLTAITELIADGILARVIVVSPAKVVSHWHKETAKWQHLTLDVAAGTGKQRLAEMVKSKSKILCTSYESLPALLLMDHGCDGLLLDEITRLRASGGRTYRSLYKSIKKFTWRQGLSASPLAEDWAGVFGMTKILDLGDRFGRNKQKFLEQYFVSDFKGYRFDPKPTTPRALTAALKSMVHVIGEDVKRGSMAAAVVSHTVPVTLPDTIIGLSRDIVKDFISDDLTGVTAANSAVAINKCRQLAQGFVYSDDGDPHILWSGRFDQCAELVTAVGPGVVVVYEYQTAGDELQRLLPDADRIAGGMNKNEFERIMACWRQGNGEVLLLQSKAGSHGLDGLQMSASNIVFFSPIWSNDGTLQLIGRLDRTGQTRAVNVYHMVADGIDRSVVDRVGDKQRVFKDFISYLQRDAFGA